MEVEGRVCDPHGGDAPHTAFAVLTDEGFSALEAAAPVHVEGVRTHLFDQLDVEELRRISERVLEHLVAVKELSLEELGRLGMPLQPRS
jgi:hypothetical protein